MLGLAVGVALSSLSTAQADPMNVQATVQGTCLLGTLSDVDFLTLTPGTSGDGAATGTIEWRCTNDTNAEILIDDGQRSDRTMLGDGPLAETMAYDLYTDNLYANRWGGVAGDGVSVTGTGMAIANIDNVDVYGRVLEADYINLEPADYLDVVDVTINLTP
jgi:spore coat protein U-like protein